VVADSGSSSAADADLDSADKAAAADRSRDLIGRLSRRRAESGFSQAHVARLMQTSQSVVARLESGQHDAQLSTVTRYADALGVSLDFGEDTGTSADAATDPQPGQPARPSARARPGRKPKGSVPVVIPEIPGKPDPDHVLTWRQRKVLQVIRESVQQRGYPPSMREIGEAVGLTSTSSVSYQLSTLQRKGYLRRDISRPRSVEVRLPGHPAMSPSREEPLPGFPAIDVLSQNPAYVPVIGRIAAGMPMSPGESVLEVMPLPRQLVGEGALFVVKVTGDSMINAAITDGDWVVVQPGFEARDGEVVVADIDGVPTVRTLKRTEGHVWLLPHHPSYAATAGDKVSILGRVVSVLRKL
jgi:repressor LexA